MAAVAVERRPAVGGIVPFSAVDYPGQLCAVVFVRGCPWRCGYCHNPHLQARGRAGHGWDEVRALLERRRHLLDAVVFSGGEPTSDPALGDAIDEVRAWGLGVGLHTAGVYPRRLARVLPKVDWVGLDVKAPFSRYDAVTGVPGSGVRARAALRAVLASPAGHEVRTTWHPALVSERELVDLGRLLARMGVRRYALQAFRGLGCADAALRAAAVPSRPGGAVLDALDALFPDFIFREAE